MSGLTLRTEDLLRNGPTMFDNFGIPVRKVPSGMEKSKMVSLSDSFDPLNVTWSENGVQKEKLSEFSLRSKVYTWKVLSEGIRK